MRGRPECKLDPRIKAVWRISDAIVLTIIFLCVVLVGVILWLADQVRDRAAELARIAREDV